MKPCGRLSKQDTPLLPPLPSPHLPSYPAPKYRNFGVRGPSIQEWQGAVEPVTLVKGKVGGNVTKAIRYRVED